ncbi:uncharacterized protein AMSG_08280 [Thecamonas trahens ATCC 50062]|uniref:Uncharacterized protein n=1 Tax=Thecamonas trahens ATCC 50062 TaxID=461836 RepID=A0A0L0DI88_THETB|nr:hypothetical protein AMSG_08280 [Thecamonas trahens ATCC 50062]KNC52027.1 hypothetical protein AMSG_08280 [Thecamonas trahens ATCC 50062]|eukprot:XP_013755610.1 hypothetical protein AMSG_08280 [Thecamonas trahens ATCC 50062]
MGVLVVVVSQILELRTMWEIPSIVQFCNVFADALDGPRFTVTNLEMALVVPGNQLLADIHVALLRAMLPKSRVIDEFTYVDYLAEVFDTYEAEYDWDDSNPFRPPAYSHGQIARAHARRQKAEREAKRAAGEMGSSSDDEEEAAAAAAAEEAEYLEADEDGSVPYLSYSDITLEDRVCMLHTLCLWQLEYSKPVTEAAHAMHGNDLRVELLGYDADDRQYYYFGGLRLYRETETPDDEPDLWENIASSEDDWKAVLKELGRSRDLDQKELVKAIKKRILPNLKAEAAEEARISRVHAGSLVPRKMSSRLMKKGRERAAEREASLRLARELAEREAEEAARRGTRARRSSRLDAHAAESEAEAAAREKEERVRRREERAQARLIAQQEQALAEAEEERRRAEEEERRREERERRLLLRERRDELDAMMAKISAAFESYEAEFTARGEPKAEAFRHFTQQPQLLKVKKNGKGVWKARAVRPLREPLPTPSSAPA